jgi:Sec-independent protein translocase protein TatA
MIEDKHMAAVKDAAKALREVKSRLNGINSELEEAQAVLPERRWPRAIDDDISEAVVALDRAENSIDAVLRHLAEVTGQRVPDERPEPPPLPTTRRTR